MPVDFEQEKKTAVFIEEDGGLSCVIQTMGSNRRINIIISANGETLEVAKIDEKGQGSVYSIDMMCEALAGLASWVCEKKG